ncbi:MAG: DNA alkylation repair protein [bacterium]
MTYEEIITELKAEANPANVEGMARFGIATKDTLGISIPFVWALAKRIGKNHDIAERLWQSGIHEARILATIADKAEWVTPEQMESWVKDFDSWDVCDQACGNLFSWTPFAHSKAAEWAVREEEFVRRAGFALMAALAVHDKDSKDAAFQKFLPLISEFSTDDRNFVKKAVNWALRQIGKRNKFLLNEAIKVAERLAESKDAAARWIGKDAARELLARKTKLENTVD